MKCKVVDMGEIDYAGALLQQRNAVKSLQDGSGEEVLFLLEHRPVITIGRNADSSAIIADRARLHAEGIEVHDADRGGNVTYHGPGQLIGYPIIELESSRRDIGTYVRDLENVLIRTLSFFDIEGRRHPDNRGVWVADRKIASIGVRISRWVTSHGFALNITTDLSRFSLIHPCGIIGCSMTSMEKELGKAPAMNEVKARAAADFGEVFGRSMIFTPSADYSLPPGPKSKLKAANDER